MSTMSYYIMYLRKSRADDPNETVEEVLAKHERILQNYAMMNYKSKIPEENIYREVVSGETIDDRPEINQVFIRMQDKDCRGVLVVDPQRLSRGDLIDCGTVLRIFKYTNTLLVTPRKAFDLSDKYDEKSIKNELMQGSEYLDYIKEIMARGREQSVLLENNYIWPTPPYGYKKIKDGRHQKLIVDPAEGPYVTYAFNRSAEGIGARKIRNEIEAMGAKPRKGEHFEPEYINKILQNKVYLGCLCWQKTKTIKIVKGKNLVSKRIYNSDYIVIEGTHEPLIDEKTFNAVQAQHRRPRVRTNATLHNPLAGLLKCKVCGSSMERKTAKGKKPRYFCRKGQYCKNRSTTMDLVLSSIINALKEKLEDFEILVTNDTTNEIEQKRKIIDAIDTKLSAIEEKQNRLYDFLESGIYTKDVFINRNELLEKERTSLIAERSKIENGLRSIKPTKEKIASLHEAINLLESEETSAENINIFLKSFIDVIYYEKSHTSEDIQLEIILK